MTPTAAAPRPSIPAVMTASATVTSLSAGSVGEIEVLVPSERDLNAIARLLEASEAAYASAVEAARLHREILRDALIAEFGHRDGGRQGADALVDERE